MHANAVSVTCDNAIRFYREEYGAVAEHRQMFVTTHIGDNLLADSASSKSPEEPHMVKTIIHQGHLFYERGMRPLLDAIQRLNESGVPCRFLQVGIVAKSCMPKIQNEPYVTIVDKADPRVAAEYTRNADVVFVPDFISDRPYSLWLMSKFVYTVYEDKPIVVFSLCDSAKHAYAIKYPEAGVFWANQELPETLDRALVCAFRCSPSQIDRRGIRNEFSAQRIAAVFLENVKKLMADVKNGDRVVEENHG